MEQYPFKSNILNLSGINYHYLDEGKGEPIVMLHGNPTWSFYYRKLVYALRNSYRIIVPDHIGCGFSDKPDERHYSYTLQSRVDDLEALLSYLEISRNITLVLHDWGGLIGMLFAARHPSAIERLIAMNTAAFLLPENKKLPWQLWMCRKKRIGDFLVRRLNLFCIGASFMCSKRLLSRKVRQAYRTPYNSWANRIAVLRFIQDIPLHPEDHSYVLTEQVEKNLNRFSGKPLLLCWGEKDFVFDHYFLDEWLRRFPHAEVHRFHDAGHYVLEDNGDEIAVLVKKFLEKHTLKE